MAVVYTLSNNLFTKNIVNTTYNYTYNLYDNPLTQISFILTSGTATLKGLAYNFPTSDAISLPLNVPINLTASNNMPIGAFILDASAGTVLMVASAVTRSY